MFRLSVNIGGAFDLYVSGSASMDLRNFSPPTELQEGEVDQVHLALLRYDETADYGRARYLILVMESRVAEDVRSRVREYLGRQLEREFDNLIRARNREEVANDRERVANVCEELEELWRTGAFSDADVYSSLMEEMDSSAQGADGEEAGERDGGEEARQEADLETFEARESDGAAILGHEEEMCVAGEQEGARSATGAGLGSTPGKEARERGGRPSRTWPLVAAVVVLAVWMGVGSAGMYVVYSDMTGLRSTVDGIEVKVERLFELLTTDADGGNVEALANQIKFVSKTLNDWESSDAGNPVVRMYKEVMQHVNTVKDEFAFGEEGPSPGSLMEAIHKLDESGFGVLDKQVLGDLAEELNTLGNEFVELKKEVEHLTDEKATGSGAKAINALKGDVSDLRQRIDGMADTSTETSLAHVVKRLRQEVEELKGFAPFLSYREECMFVQFALKYLDFYRGEVDGLCAGKTKKAVSAYQRYIEAEGSGVLTEMQLQRLLNEVKGGN